jgi:hypothetical protein
LQALVLGLVLGCLWLRSGWASRLSALLLGALAVRCQLKPAEVERIRIIAGEAGRGLPGSVASALCQSFSHTLLVHVLRSPAAINPGPCLRKPTDYALPS